jgi:GntR family transcriptional regulator
MSVRTGRDAVAEELRDRVITGLHTGRFSGGQRLPAVRTLAHELDVNERVVMAALRTLADEGLIELRSRSGAYIAPPQPSSRESMPHLSAWLIAMLLQARSRGLAPRDTSEFIRRNMETRRVRAACVECNLDQLHMLCTELSGDHGYLAESVPLDELNADDPPLSVRRADVLVTTVFHAEKVRRVAKALGKPWIGVVLRPDIMRGVAQLLRQGPVYFVATDPRYERKLRRMLSAYGPTTNLRVMLVPRDDPGEIPPNSPAFVMTSAREFLKKRYGSAGGPGHPIHPVRHFSDESARELLTFLVQANAAALRG